MNNLGKRYKALTVITVIIAMAIFVVKSEPVKAVASLQSSKANTTPIKTVKKRIITPNQARNFLNDLDMPTRDYENIGESGRYGKYEADSDRFILETRDTNRFLNNLSYSVFGDKYVVKALELDLNVNDVSFSSNAVGELIKYSDALMVKVTGEKLTSPIKKAIQTKTNGEWVVNGYKIKLEKEIFPDEKIMKSVESTSDHGAFSLAFIVEL